MTLLDLDHLQLAMPAGGEEDARRFYGELLGLKEIPKPEPLRARGGCWFDGPGFQIHLGVEREFVPARKAHPAFIVADVDACRRELVEAGIETISDTTVDNVERFYAADPFGNRLEFIAEGQGFRVRG